MRLMVFRRELSFEVFSESLMLKYPFAHHHNRRQLAKSHQKRICGLPLLPAQRMMKFDPPNINAVPRGVKTFLASLGGFCTGKIEPL